VFNSAIMELKVVEGGRPVGNTCGVEEGGGDPAAPETEGAFAVGGRSSGTVDCLFARLSSSASSAISISLRLRRELVEEEVDPDAVCNEQAADSVVSRSSLDEAIENSVS
jgi:hypothetical protein